MKKILLKGAVLATCALLIGGGIGLYLTRRQATESVMEKTAQSQPVEVTLQFPLGIK